MLDWRLGGIGLLVIKEVLFEGGREKWLSDVKRKSRVSGIYMLLCVKPVPA